jgi:hypothetical protein
LPVNQLRREFLARSSLSGDQDITGSCGDPAEARFNFLYREADAEDPIRGRRRSPLWKEGVNRTAELLRRQGQAKIVCDAGSQCLNAKVFRAMHSNQNYWDAIGAP